MSDLKPSSKWYKDPAFFEAEQKNVFRNLCYLVGPKSWVQDGGYWVPKHLPFPVLLTRDNHELRAFHNVCLHHKAEITDGMGKATKLSCPYHGWTYGLDGKLRGTPHLKDRPTCLSDGLSQMNVSERGPLLLVYPGNEVNDYNIPHEKDFDWDNMDSIAYREYSIDCNWKVYIENYLDGGYHVPILHKRLTNQLDLSSYKVEVKDRHVVQSVDGGSGDFQERIGSKALYIWSYPNLMLNRYGPWLTTTVVTPLSPGCTRVEVGYYIQLSGSLYLSMELQDFIDKSIKDSVQVTEEDIAICESVQRGLNSSADFEGVYVPKFEKGMEYFHQLLRRDMA